MPDCSVTGLMALPRVVLNIYAIKPAPLYEDSHKETMLTYTDLGSHQWEEQYFFMRV